MHAHCSILCITPPHMLREIAQNGTPVQQEVARKTLMASESFRAKRSAMGGMLAASLAATIIGGVPCQN